MNSEAYMIPKARRLILYDSKSEAYMMPRATGIEPGEEGEGCLEDDSLYMDRLSMELGKTVEWTNVMSSSRSSSVLLYFIVS